MRRKRSFKRRGFKRSFRKNAPRGARKSFKRRGKRQYVKVSRGGIRL